MPQWQQKALDFWLYCVASTSAEKNIIPKDALKRCFEDCGFKNVRTYIRSGNVLFRSEKAAKELTRVVEAGLSKRFSYDAQAIVISHKQYQSAVQAAPDNWGVDGAWKHNALFTMARVSPKQIMAQLPQPKADFEEVTLGRGVISP